MDRHPGTANSAPSFAATVAIAAIVIWRPDGVWTLAVCRLAESVHHLVEVEVEALLTRRVILESL